MNTKDQIKNLKENLSKVQLHAESLGYDPYSVYSLDEYFRNEEEAIYENKIVNYHKKEDLFSMMIAGGRGARLAISKNGSFDRDRPRNEIEFSDFEWFDKNKTY